MNQFQVNWPLKELKILFQKMHFGTILSIQMSNCLFLRHTDIAQFIECALPRDLIQFLAPSGMGVRTRIKFDLEFFAQCFINALKNNLLRIMMEGVHRQNEFNILACALFGGHFVRSILKNEWYFIHFVRIGHEFWPFSFVKNSKRS
jgi:hypothetical protein